MFGTRAARAAVGDPADGPPPPSPGWRFQPPTERTRADVWELAGPRRRGDQLERLLDDPYPLARLIAAAGLARRESRGSHRRSDFPLPDHELDAIHLMVGPAEALRTERWT